MEFESKIVKLPLDPVKGEHSIMYRKDDGKFNATHLCEQYGKPWSSFYRLSSTKKLLQELCGSDEPHDKLVESKKHTGTYISQSLLLPLAHYLSTDCEEAVKAMLPELEDLMETVGVKNEKPEPVKIDKAQERIRSLETKLEDAKKTILELENAKAILEARDKDLTDKNERLNGLVVKMGEIEEKIRRWEFDWKTVRDYAFSSYGTLLDEKMNKKVEKGVWKRFKDRYQKEGCDYNDLARRPVTQVEKWHELFHSAYALPINHKIPRVPDPPKGFKSMHPRNTRVYPRELWHLIEDELFLIRDELVREDTGEKIVM
jgi:hypothetical protein